MKKAVIFDVDGVMLDSEPLFDAGRRSLCAKYGFKETDRKNLNGSGIRAYWSSVLEFNGNKTLDANTLAVENFDFVFDGIIKNSLGESTGLTSLLKSLNGKYRLAVGSSSDRRYVEFVLKHLGAIEYFDVIVCGDEVERTKPFGDIYLKVLELLNMNCDECYVIEDSDNGICAAIAASIDCIGVSLADPPTQSFDGCKVKFDSLKQVEEFLTARDK